MKKRKLLVTALILSTAIQMAAQTQRKITIEELFSLVESGNNSLRQQRSAIEIASHEAEAARSQRLPDIDASLSLTYNGNVLMLDRNFSNAHGLSQPHFGNSFSLQVEQVVYSGGAITSGIRLAELRKSQAETSMDATRANQRYIALGEYLDIFTIGKSITVYESNIALTQRLIEDIKAKQEQGMALRNDVTRYELQLESLNLGLRALRDRLSILNHRLCNTLGLENVEIVPDASVIEHTVDECSEADWQNRALTMSPSLRLSELSIKSAQEQLQMAKSDMRPKIALFAIDNFNGPFTYDIPPIDKNFNIWCVGIGLKYSLSSLFKNNKNVRRAEAAIIGSRDSYSVEKESVNNNVQQAYTLYQQAFVNLRTRQKSVELATQNYDIVNQRYLNQLALITDMIDASNTKLDAELQEVQARINIIYAYYTIKFATGTI